MALTFHNAKLHYKTAIIRLCSLLISLGLGTSVLSQSPRPTPDAYLPGTKVNYVRTWEAAAPDTNPNALMTRHFRDARQTTQYQDGLGRLVQTVIRQGSMSTGSAAVDFISPILYDGFGRETYKYLPTPANSTGGNASISDGQFKLNSFHQQANFMQQQYGSQYELYFYAQTEFEAAPLDRVQKVMGAGNSWAGAGRGVSTKYWINTAIDSVRIWTVTNVTDDWGTYSSGGFYTPGELFKTVTIDEHDNQVIDFTDKSGKLILQKVQLTATADAGSGKGYTGWLSTYHIYDNRGNPRCVVQPRGVELLLQNNWNITALSNAILNEQCFRYEYDHSNRMIMKKLPGAGDVYMVYDAKDRLVLLQDANLRSGSPQKWQYTQYDNLNRPIATGTWDNSNTRIYHADRADTSISYPNLSGQTITELTNTFYDDYSWRSNYGNPLSDNLNTDNSIYLLTPSNTTWPYPQSVSKSLHTTGLLTGTRTRVLGSATYLYTATFYDDDGRQIQEQSKNITNGTNSLTTQYSWGGLPLLTIQQTEKSNPNSQTTVVLTKTNYDSLWRVSTTEKKIRNSLVDGGAMPETWTEIEKNNYNALSQVWKKLVSPIGAPGGGPLDSLVYVFNIQGQMLGMNRQYVKDTNSTANYFGFDLGYDKDTIVINGTNKFYAGKLYNGNISGMLWKSTGDDQLRKYDFTYDAADRLTNANFSQLTNNAFNLNEGVDFSVKGLSYDGNGNILTMNQKGWKPGGSQTIDSLLYTYINYSNRLQNVLDRKNDTATRLGDFRTSKAYMDALSQNKTTSATDYYYDTNGNLVRDLNKDIKNGGANGITYNHLNLPDVVYVNGKGTITYIYDASGNKLKRITVDSTTNPIKTTTTLYLSGLEYKDDTLQQVAHEEGRIRFKKEDTSFVYDYFLRDHLGNVRMVLTEEEQLNVYPEVTFEDANVSNELIYYDSVDQERVARPGSFFTSTTNGNKVQLLRKSTQPIGAGKLLKVMATDRLHIKVDYYTPDDPTDNSSANGLNSVLGTLLSMINAASAPAAIKGSGTVITNELNNSSLFTSFLAPQGTGTSSSIPKAYINILFFDEQFRFVTQNSEIIQITTKGSAQQITRISGNAKVAQKNGYAYIYLSNESNNLVYFDNFQVSHERGAILEETHYYSFGLTMAGISTKAVGVQENKFKFNGETEINTDLALNWYETEFRTYDPQLGRFWQMDELAEGNEEWSMYAFANDNPILLNDPMGLFADTVTYSTQWLAPVTVTGKIGGYQLYLNRLILGQAVGLDRPVYLETDNENIKQIVEDWYGFESRRYQMNKEIFDFTLEAASWAIPAGKLLKLAKLRKVLTVLKLKRGKAVVNTLDDVADDVAGLADDGAKTVAPKKVPNPGGRRGSLAHQARVTQAEQMMLGQGHMEHLAGGSLPEMKLGKRFADLLYLNTRTGKYVAIQVGKTTKGGLPVAREVRAMKDLKALKTQVEHVFFIKY